MRSLLRSFLVFTVVLSSCALAEWTPPAEHPRTPVSASQLPAFRKYCLEGDGKMLFETLRKEFDEKVMDRPFPEEPENYGDPDPRKRVGELVFKWKAAHEVCGFVGGVIEAGSILWIVTGEEKYLEKARTFFIEVCKWPADGTTNINYNDESHFRLWRKLPVAYDLMRDEFSAEEKAIILPSLASRGRSGFELITNKGKITEMNRNTPNDDSKSHSIRFMSHTGMAGLALYDDLPEAKDWWNTAVTFYKTQFPIWGGDDGGWAEGPGYWRAVLEHGKFQDTLLAVGHPDAWTDPFWRQTGYFPLYFVQGYPVTGFGDMPQEGMDFDDDVMDFNERAGRRYQDGFLISTAALNPTRKDRFFRDGLYIGRNYPTGMEHLLREFTASLDPRPEAKPLTDLPAARYFADIGWVSMHSSLGNSKEDIQLSFKSSPYASHSHSHADQNAFLINAYGEGLAINSGYREYHRSVQHKNWSQETVSKNALLIGGKGQSPRDIAATGKITRFETAPRTVWTTGDATIAYRANTEGQGENITKVIRDIVMIDKRYFVVRDHVELTKPSSISWLLHAKTNLSWDLENQSILIKEGGAQLCGRLVSDGNTFTGEIIHKFPAPIDPNFVNLGFPEQVHFRADTVSEKTGHTIFCVLWPSRDSTEEAKLEIVLTGSDTLTVKRPDGGTDKIQLTDEALMVESVDN